MKILIIGGTRYLGPRLVAHLIARGHEPILFNRGITKAPAAVKSQVRTIHGDRNEGCELLRAVKNEAFDAVVDTQAFCGADAERIVDVLSDRVGKCLVISSAACYGRLTFVPADETHPYINEKRSFPGQANAYACGKRDVERVLLTAHQEKGFPVVIIRPSVSYGYGRLFSIWAYSSRHVARIREGKEIIVPDTGESLIQPVFIDDEAEIIERALTSEGAVGEAFNCAGAVAVPLWQYFSAYGEAMGIPVKFVQIPASFLEGFDPVLCVRASQNLIFNHAYDVSKLRRVLGFIHRYSLVEGLKKTIEFQDRWNLIEPTQDGDPDDLLIEAFRSRFESKLRAFGENVRKEKGYTPPESSPLIKWAPDHYKI